jgi:hypothetical protein
LLCNSEYSVIPPPALYGNSPKSSKSSPFEHQKCVPNSQNTDRSVSTNAYKIITNNGTASVLTSTFQRLGSTPLELNKQTYEGKLILVSNGKETKRITLNSHQNLIVIKFD